MMVGLSRAELDRISEIIESHVIGNGPSITGGRNEEGTWLSYQFEALSDAQRDRISEMDVASYSTDVTVFILLDHDETVEAANRLEQGRSAAPAP